MQISGTAVHVYDTPAPRASSATELPWGRIVAMIVALVLVGAAALAIFGILVQRL